MTDTLMGAIIGVGGTIVGALLAGPIAYYFSKRIVRKTHENALALMQRQEFLRAVSKFRSAIIYELSGLYPIDQHWGKENFHRLYQSLPKINSIATEFRFFVRSKDSFDEVIKEYNKYCRETKGDEIYTLDFPSMTSSGDMKPKDKFNNIVERLLSFTDENKYKNFSMEGEDI